jgi:thymidylate synthase ThyX
MIRMVEERPYVPTHWGKNQKGMQADEEIDGEHQGYARDYWLGARDAAVEQAQLLLQLGVHKQITNRLLEPFMWHTCIVSSTEWSNWDHLRANKMAHPEIKLAAELMLDTRLKNEPRPVDYGDWHLPFIEGTEPLDEGSKEWACKVSVGRCARVSYLTHDGKRDPDEDVKLCDRLLASGHMSPFEHVARPMQEEDFGDPQLGLEVWRKGGSFCGNFRGWVQMRKLIPNEHDILGGA